MWGPTALLVGKSECFDVLLFVRLLCNMPLAHQAADLVSVSGAKGIEGNHPGVCSGMTCPPSPSLSLSSFYGRPPALGRGTTGPGNALLPPHTTHVTTCNSDTCQTGAPCCGMPCLTKCNWPENAITKGNYAHCSGHVKNSAQK